MAAYANVCSAVNHRRRIPIRIIWIMNYMISQSTAQNHPRDITWEEKSSILSRRTPYTQGNLLLCFKHLTKSYLVARVVQCWLSVVHLKIILSKILIFEQFTKV